MLLRQAVTRCAAPLPGLKMPGLPAASWSSTFLAAPGGRLQPRGAELSCNSSRFYECRCVYVFVARGCVPVHPAVLKCVSHVVKTPTAGTSRQMMRSAAGQDRQAEMDDFARDMGGRMVIKV